MPLNKEAIRRLNGPELHAVFSSEAFSSQKEEILKALQAKNQLDYDTFTGAHREEGCKTVYVFRGYSDSPFVDIDLMPHSYKHWSFYCRKHGVSSETFVDMSFPGEPSSIGAEEDRYNFVQHIIGEASEDESLTQAWNKFEGYILSWAKDYKGLHYLSDYNGKLGDISPFLEKVQAGVKTLANRERNTRDSVLAAGLFSQMVFGVDGNFGPLLEGLTDEEKKKAILFCKEILPDEMLQGDLRVLEGVNWSSVAPSQ